MIPSDRERVTVGGGIAGAALVLMCALLLGACTRPRTLSLHVVADSSFRSRDSWETELRQRVARVSGALADQVAVRLGLVQVGSWEVADTRSIDALARALQTVDRVPGAILVGIYGRELPNDAAGDAVPFTARVVIAAPPGRSSSSMDARFAHELAHLFGVWHSTDAASLMSTAPTSLRLDAQARSIFRLTRTFDFTKGLEQIDSAAEQRIATLFGGGHPPGERNPIAQSHTGQGIRLQADGRPVDAVAHYRQALRLEPNDATYHHNLGFGLSDAGELAEAIAEFREAVRLAPDSATGHESLALALARQGQLNEAVEEFRQALRRAPKKASAHFNLGLTLAHIEGREPEAERELEEALRLDPNYSAAREALDAVRRRLASR